MRCGVYELASDKIELSMWSQSENEETSMTLSTENNITTLLGEAFYFQNGETVSFDSNLADISAYGNLCENLKNKPLKKGVIVGQIGPADGTQFQICLEWY